MDSSRGEPAPITPPDNPGEPPPEEMPVRPDPGIVPDYPPPEEEPQPAVIPGAPHEPLPAEDPLPLEPEPDPEPVQPPGEDPVPASARDRSTLTNLRAGDPQDDPGGLRRIDDAPIGGAVTFIREPYLARIASRI